MSMSDLWRVIPVGWCVVTADRREKLECWISILLERNLDFRVLTAEFGPTGQQQRQWQIAFNAERSVAPLFAQLVEERCG